MYKGPAGLERGGPANMNRIWTWARDVNPAVERRLGEVGLERIEAGVEDGVEASLSGTIKSILRCDESQNTRLFYFLRLLLGLLRFSNRKGRVRVVKAWERFTTAPASSASPLLRFPATT